MNLRDYIAQHGTTSGEMAEKLGVTKEALRRYVAGERTPRPETLRKIVEVTGGKVTFADLIGQAA